MRYLKLSERASDPARRERLGAEAETWTKLAAELEADQALLNTLSELEFDEPCYELPTAMHLRAV
jgi:hypothetical protein